MRAWFGRHRTPIGAVAALTGIATLAAIWLLADNTVSRTGPPSSVLVLAGLLLVLGFCARLTGHFTSAFLCVYGPLLQVVLALVSTWRDMTDPLHAPDGTVFYDWDRSIVTGAFALQVFAAAAFAIATVAWSESSYGWLERFAAEKRAGKSPAQREGPEDDPNWRPTDPYKR